MHQLLWLEHTGRSLLTENLDSNAGGGFTLDTLSTDSLQGGTEVYRPVEYKLRSIRVRAPGLHAGKPIIVGTTESSQVLELALLHEAVQSGTLGQPGTNDGNWAVVYIPFVKADSPLQNDPMLPFVVDAQFPTQKGQTGHAQLRLPWNLDAFMPSEESATMLHYWGNFVTPPCGPDVLARHFVRQEPIPIGAGTLEPILAVLGKAAENAGLMSPSSPRNAWQIPICSGLAESCPSILPKGVGYNTTKTNLIKRLSDATAERTAARTNLQQVENALNNSLVEIEAAKSGNTVAQNQSDKKFDGARNLATTLRSAEQRMEAAQFNEAQAYADLQALPAKDEWDLDRPDAKQIDSRNNATSSASQNLKDPFGSESSDSTANANLKSEDSGTNSTSSATESDLSLLNLVLGTSDTEESADSDGSINNVANLASFAAGGMAEAQSCEKWDGVGSDTGLSPIDIKTADVADLASLAQLSSPAMFRYDGDLEDISSRRRLWLENTGGSLRATALPSDNEAAGGPLGMLTFGAEGLYELKTVELKLPGEHSVDGHVPVAELQLIHHRQSQGGEAKHAPVIVLAVRLEEAKDGEDNPWLEALVNTLPRVDEAMEVYGAPLWTAATGLTATSGIPPYYRYDGVTTSPPCSAAQWFMLEDTGFVSPRQLDALKLVLMAKPAPLPHPIGERIVVRNSPLALQKKSAKALLQAWRKRRLSSTNSIAP